MKFSTLVLKVTKITTDRVSYTTLTDIQPREYEHIIPRNSQFPFEDIIPGDWYTVIAVRPTTIWLWWKAYSLSESITLVDESLEVQHEI